MNGEALVEEISRRREANERDWKSYYLSKAGQGDYFDILEWPLEVIQDRFEEDDWQHLVHDYELEEAVEQGIGYDAAMSEVLDLLRKESDA